MWMTAANVSSEGGGAMTLMPPLGILYRISDLLAPIVYHVVRYRRRLVRKNLTESFPDKPLSEIKRIERRFYRNFTDNFIEAIKLLGITDREMRRRVVFGGVEKVDEYLSQGKTIIAYFAHTANWEWAPSITLWTSKQRDSEAVFAQVYRRCATGIPTACFCVCAAVSEATASRKRPSCVTSSDCGATVCPP